MPVADDVVLQPATPESAELIPDLMYLSVTASGRNRGIGRRLLENAFDRARDAGLKSVHLDVYDGNPAIRLYERAGMKKLIESRVPGLERDYGIPAHFRMVLDL